MRRTGRIASVPVGEELIGRIVNPLGQPVDGGPPIATSETRPLEFKAPGVVDRQPVKEPVQTGIKAIDSMIPIGRGQRELIIGDRSIGKTALLVDTILNQRGQDLICIYVAIGQKSSTVKQVYERLKDAGAMDYTIIVNAPANEAAPMKWMAPYAGCGDGRVLSVQGQARALHVRRPLQARRRVPPDVAAAAASSGTRGVPGRRLLPPLAPARARLQALGRSRRRLADRAAGDRDAGWRRCGLHPDERHLHHRRPDLPRVRPLLLRRSAGDQRRRLGLACGRQRPGAGDAPGGRPPKLDLSQYRELEAFAQFGSELDQATRDALGRGERMVATLNQPQYSPWALEEQVVAIFAGGEGYLDRIPVEDVARFQDELREHLRSEGSIYAEINDKKELSDELQEKLHAELKKFVGRFSPSGHATPHSQMATVQDLRRRIKSVTNTRKITKAMELVASARLRRAQARIEAMRPFADRMLELMVGTARAVASVHGLPLLQQRDVKTVAILPLTGDRGLAGSFNTQVLRHAFALDRNAPADGLACAGSSPDARARRRSASVATGRPGVDGFLRPARLRGCAGTRQPAVRAVRRRRDRPRGRIYNHYVSPLVQTVVEQDVLPIPEDLLARGDEAAAQAALLGDVIYEPEPEEILARLLPFYLETELYRALLESAASEQGARMTAMRNASKNAGELIDSLTLQMNRARQAEITQEILEVVAGADALNAVDQVRSSNRAVATFSRMRRTEVVARRVR